MCKDAIESIIDVMIQYFNAMIALSRLGGGTCILQPIPLFYTGQYTGVHYVAASSHSTEFGSKFYEAYTLPKDSIRVILRGWLDDYSTRMNSQTVPRISDIDEYR